MRLGGGALLQAKGQSMALGRLHAVDAPAEAAVVTPLTLTFHGDYRNSADQAVYLNAGAAIGAAAPDRFVIVAIFANSASARSLTSIYIGGVLATVIVGPSGTATRHLVLAYANVPLGTTADIEVTYSGNLSDFCLLHWTIRDTTQTNYYQRAAINPQVAPAANSISANGITVPAGGCLIAVALVNSATGGPVAWTQTTGTGTRVSDARVTGVANVWGSAWQTTEAGGQTDTADGRDATDHYIAAFSWAA